MMNRVLIPSGKMASDAASEIRKQLAEKLRRGETIEVGNDGDVTGRTGGNRLVVQEGKLASDAASEIRKQLAEKLRRGETIEVGNDGDVTGRTGGNRLVVQEGKLASDAASEIRKQLAEKLRRGETIEVGNDGDVTGRTGGNRLVVQEGKLAVRQWYEIDPQRLADEKEAMRRFFPRFTLHKKNDGRLYWYGTLRLNVLPNGWPWEIAAIYNNDHPHPVMGGSVRVVLINPDINTVINALGWTPHHLLRSNEDGCYLCTTRAEDISYGTRFETTAVQTISWAVKWLTALELVLSGDMSKDLFNSPNGI